MTLPVPSLSFSALRDYKYCPAQYYLKRVDPERKHRPPPVYDATETVPGHAVHKIFEIALKCEPGSAQVKEFRLSTVLNNNLLKSIFNEYSEDPNVKYDPANQYEWSRSETSAFSFVKECRNTLLDALQQGDFIRPFMLREYWFGHYQAPLALNDQLKVCGALDLFSADTPDAPGRLVDYKAAFSDYALDQDQLKLYWMALEKKGFKVGMSAFLLFRTKRKPIYHAFPKGELRATTDRFVDISKNIQKELFDYTPSVPTCRKCDFRNECPKAVLSDQPVAPPKGVAAAGTPAGEVPEL